MPVNAIKSLLGSDTELQAKAKEAVATLSPPQQATWADKVRPKPPPQVSSKAKGKGKQKGTGHEPVRGPRFAVKINPTEWSGEPSLTTLPKLEQALTQGEEPSGNLIITADPQVVAQAKNLWAAFDCKTQKLTIATINNKPSSSASVSVWWKEPGKNASGPPNRVQLQLSQIGTSPGPVPITAVVTNIPKPQGSKMVTVRFLAPAFYRKHVPGVSKEDDPATVIGCLASTVGCQASLLTGGRWEVATHPHGRILIGHLKVTEELAQRLAKVSGTQALFVAVLNQTNQKEVAWLPRAKQETEAYFRQSLTRAQAAKMPLVLRQGGGSDLGIVGMSQREVSANLVRTWEFHGCPRHWTNQEVSEFLEANNWAQTEVLNKIRRSAQQVWLFKAKAAPAQENRENDFWYYTNQDQTLHLTIAPIRPRARKVISVEQVPGPRKRWFDKPAVAKVAATQLDDLTMDDPATQPSDNKERSPRRQKTEKVLDPDKVFLAQNPDWVFVDNGGAGDCAFQSAAHCIAVSQGKTLNTEARTREASRLRLLATGHMTSNRSYFEPFWAQDPDEEAQLRNFQNVPQDFADYILAASNRGYYADDLLLTALAARLATPIIVFPWSSERKVWERTVVANRFIEGSAEVGKKSLRPMILMQSQKHYRALCPIKNTTEVPAAWLQQTDTKDRKFFRGGGSKSVVSRLSLPGSSAPSVPGRSALSLPSSRPSHNASKKSGSQAPSRLNLPSMSPSRRFRTLKKSRDTNCRKSANKDTGFALSLPSSSTLSQKVRLDYSQIGSEIGTPPGSARKRSRICVKRVQDGSSLSLPPGSETSLGICKSQGSDFGQGGRVGNNSSKKRKAEVLDEVPPAHGTGSAGNQVLWWTRTFPGCKYEVWRTPGSHHHTSRRWTHLRNTHKVPVADIPRADSSDVVREAQANRKKLTWKFVLPLLVKHKSIGMHRHPGTLSATGSGFPFKCQACQQQIQKSVYGSQCSADVVPNRQPLTRAQRSKLWLKCWTQAAKQAKSQAQKERLAQRKEAVRDTALRKQQLWQHNNLRHKETRSRLKGIPCAPVALDTVW